MSEILSEGDVEEGEEEIDFILAMYRPVELEAGCAFISSCLVQRLLVETGLGGE